MSFTVKKNLLAMVTSFPKYVKNQFHQTILHGGTPKKGSLIPKSLIKTSEVIWIQPFRKLATHVDNLHIVKELGEGGFAKVDEVRDPIFKELYAVKSCKNGAQGIIMACLHEVQITRDICQNNKALAQFLVAPIAYWISKDSEAKHHFNILMDFYSDGTLANLGDVCST